MLLNKKIMTNDNKTTKIKSRRKGMEKPIRKDGEGIKQGAAGC